MKRFFVGLGLLAFALCAPRAAFCANVSMMLVATGPGSRAEKPVAEWESGMMDEFFNAGHIVSNARSVSLAETPQRFPPSVFSAMNEAAEHFFDYFVVVSLDFPQADDVRRPASIAMELFQLGDASPKLLYSDVYEWSSAPKTKLYYINAEEAMRILLPYIGGAL